MGSIEDAARCHQNRQISSAGFIVLRGNFLLLQSLLQPAEHGILLAQYCCRAKQERIGAKPGQALAKGGRIVKNTAIRTVGVMALVMAVVGFSAVSASASLLHVQTFFLEDVLSGDAEELAFVQNYFSDPDAELISKTNLGTDDNTTLVTFDAGTLYVLVKDGAVSGDHLYSIWAVDAAQQISGGSGTVGFVGTTDGNSPTEAQLAACDGKQVGEDDCVFVNKGISHVSVFGGPGTGVPEPSLFVLLGTGLLGTLAFARRFV